MSTPTSAQMSCGHALYGPPAICTCGTCPQRERAPCPICEGDGDIIESGEQVGPCTHCRTTGAVDVGVFEMKCPTPCVDCDGLDHHWMPHDTMDFSGEALMICKHCSALRHFSDEDDEISPVFDGPDPNIGPAHWGKTTQGRKA